ncbi:MAG: hypothetical protein J6D03_02500 [Clostridia bacterium]|nr:hypothetical protein [Clostridia bacterium]MBO5530526.1 hypothetical protein [Bacilli bacterium]
MNNFKLHLHKYFFYDLLAIFLFILISFIGIKLYNAYQINKKIEYDFSSYDSFMYEVYNINPNLFKFDSNGIAKVEMNDLLRPITNGKDTIYFGVVPLTKEQDQCVGYIIVEKTNDDLKFDYSHLCDMVDY